MWRQNEKLSEEPAQGGGAQLRDRESPESGHDLCLTDQLFDDDPFWQLQAIHPAQGDASHLPVPELEHRSDITSSDVSSSDLKQVEEIQTVSASPKFSAVKNNPSPAYSEGARRTRSSPIFSDPFHLPEIEVDLRNTVASSPVPLVKRRVESKTVGRAVGRKPRFISLRRLLKKDTPEVRENLEANEFEDEARIEHQNVETEEGERAIQRLTAEVHLYKIEVEELRNKIERSRTIITELGKTNASLETKLSTSMSNEERESLTRQNRELRTVETFKERFDAFVHGTQEHLAQLAGTVASKAVENEELNEKVKNLAEELELTKFQAFTYKQDFEEERAAREQAVGAKERLDRQVQSLSDQLSDTKTEAEFEKNKKQAEITKLEVTVTKNQQLTWQLTQAQENFQQTIATMLQEIEAEKAQKEHFRTESTKLQQQLQIAEATCESRKDELFQKIEEAARSQAALKDEVQMASAMNISLNEKLERVTQDRDIEQEQLEILANEKAFVDNQLTREKNHTAALAQDLAAKEQELSHTKETDDRKATELQDARQRLEVSLADTERLNDEEKRMRLSIQQLQGALKILDQQSKILGGDKKQQPVISVSDNAEVLNSHSLKPKSPLMFTEPVGQGSFGSVYAVDLDGLPCIGKRLLDILMGRCGQQEVCQATKNSFHQRFVQECVLMSRTNHSNIVKFIGVYFGKNEFDLTLLMERLHTDLGKYLESKPLIVIPYSTKVSILHDVSCGLLYLHEKCSIIHRDLTAANILLTADNRAKIADLGVSKILDNDTQKLTVAPGTQAFMPPEAVQENPSYNESLDIFSFGVLVLYVAIQQFPALYGRRVTDAVHAKGEGEIFKRQKWIEMMEAKHPQLSFMIFWCLSDNPMKRPSTCCVNILLQAMTINL